jgi:hypothetical protein
MEGLRGYLQLASGLAETSRAKATEAASALIALTGGLSSARSSRDVQVQVQDLAEELMAAAAANRRSLLALIRSEVERAVARSPIPPDELDRARAAVAKLSADVEELRAQVLGNPAVGEVAARLGLAGHTASRPATGPLGEDGSTDSSGVVVDAAFTATPEAPTPAPPRRRPPRKQIAAQAASRPVTPAADADAGEESAEPRTDTGVMTAADATSAPGRTGTAPTTGAAQVPATKASATKAPGRKGAAKKATASGGTGSATTKKSTAKKTAAKKTAAKKSAAKKSAAKKNAAQKSTEKRSAAKNATATKSATKKTASTTAKKATASEAASPGATRSAGSGGSGGSGGGTA